MASQNPDDYSDVFPTLSLPILEREAIALSLALDADGAKFQASAVRQAYFQLLRELKVIAQDIANAAKRYIVEEQIAGQVRPDTGGRGGPRLQDFIGESSPLHAVEGSVGVNDKDLLANSPVSWWWTVDEGYDWRFHEDADIRGYFMGPPTSAPGDAPSGTHPLFQATGPKGPPMEPMEPIKPQHFVRRGTARAERDWHSAVDAARARFMSECRQAVASAPAAGVPTGRRRTR